MKPRILLTATESWPSAACYAGGLAAAGCEVFALAPAFAPVHRSRHVAARRVYRPFSPLNGIHDACADTSPDLIVSCDERALGHLLQIYPAEKAKSSSLAALLARSLGVPENYQTVLSRSAGLEVLRDTGVRVPETLAAPTLADLDRALERIGFPAVLKADETWAGEGVAIAQTHDEAHQAWRRLSNPPSRARSLYRFVRRRNVHHFIAAVAPRLSKVSVQRFVAGRMAASAFVACSGEVKALFCYDVLVARDGGKGPPQVVRRIDCPEMEGASRAVAAKFGLSGAHGIDFIRDEQGHAHLIEINPRATQGGTLPFGFGRDIPHALASMVTPGPVGIRSPLVTDVVEFHAPARGAPDAIHRSVPWRDGAAGALGAQV